MSKRDRAHHDPLERCVLTRRSLAAGVLSGCLGSSGQLRAQTPIAVERTDLLAHFQAAGSVGTFALHDPATDGLIVVDGKRAATRYVPASTFKIANSLIALETRVVADENEVIPFGGRPQRVKAWERDMSLRDAIVHSNVPVYQEIARRVGLARYQTWLERLDYGNRQTGQDVEQFWLRGPLAISAIEQARFASRLALGQLPLSSRSQAIVRTILRLEANAGRELYGKTGWFVSEPLKLGWLTGWVEVDGRKRGFSLNIDMPRIDDAPKRTAIAKAILAHLGLL